MSADESALLAAVAADPAADLPRLVYADWLDDHGQPIRAEFIRLQCEIARLEVGPRAVVDANWRLWKRQQDMLDDHLPELLGLASFLADCRPEFRRGFVAAVTLHVERFDALELPDSPLPRLVPLPRITVTNVWALPDAFLSGARYVDLVAEAVVYDAAAFEVREPATYWIQGRPAQSTPFTRLEIFDWTDCQIADYGLNDLLSLDLPAVRDLRLGGCELSDDGVITLLNTGLPQRLARLVLDGNPLTDQSAFELADRLAPVKTFRTLDIRRTQIGQAGQLALTSAFGSRCNLF